MLKLGATALTTAAVVYADTTILCDLFEFVLVFGCFRQFLLILPRPQLLVSFFCCCLVTFHIVCSKSGFRSDSIIQHYSIYFSGLVEFIGSQSVDNGAFFFSFLLFDFGGNRECVRVLLMLFTLIHIKRTWRSIEIIRILINKLYAYISVQRKSHTYIKKLCKITNDEYQIFTFLLETKKTSKRKEKRRREKETIRTRNKTSK